MGLGLRVPEVRGHGNADALRLGQNFYLQKPEHRYGTQWRDPSKEMAAIKEAFGAVVRGLSAEAVVEIDACEAAKSESDEYGQEKPGLAQYVSSEIFPGKTVLAAAVKYKKELLRRVW